MIFLAAPVTPTGPIAVGAFSPQTLIQHTLENIFDSNEGGSAFVVTPGHQLLFSTGALVDSVSLTDHPGVDAAIQGQSGSTYMQAGNNEHVVAYSPVALLGWALVIEEPWPSVVQGERVPDEQPPNSSTPLCGLSSWQTRLDERFPISGWERGIVLAEKQAVWMLIDRQAMVFS